MLVLPGAGNTSLRAVAGGAADDAAEGEDAAASDRRTGRAATAVAEAPPFSADPLACGVLRASAPREAEAEAEAAAVGEWAMAAAAVLNSV